MELEFIFALVAVLVVLCTVIGLYVLVAMMAKHRHREVAVWLLLSFFFSPIVIMIILLCIGEDDSYKYVRDENREV